MTNNQSNEPENREQTFDEKLDDLIKFYVEAMVNSKRTGYVVHPTENVISPYQGKFQLKQAIKTLVLEDVVGDSEVHVSHVCPQDSVGCAKYAQRCATRRHQRQIINPQKEVK